VEPVSPMRRATSFDTGRLSKAHLASSISRATAAQHRFAKGSRPVIACTPQEHVSGSVGGRSLPVLAREDCLDQQPPAHPDSFFSQSELCPPSGPAESSPQIQQSPFDFDGLRDDAPKQCTGCRIAAVVNGSLGDVQPLVALALRLKQLQHTVRIFTNSNLVEVCESRGIEGVSVFADCQAVIESIRGMSGDMLEGSLRGKTAAEAWLRAHPTRCVAAEDAMEDFKPHVILCGTQASGPALRYEMNFAVPTVFIFLFKEGVTEFRDHVDFEPPRPSLFAVHPWLSGELDAPSRNLHQPGGFVLEESVSEDDISQDGPWHELHRFIQAGPPPVAIGWGSMIANGLPPSAMLELALDVLRLGCRRGVVIGGWARLQHLGQQLLAGQSFSVPVRKNQENLLILHLQMFTLWRASPMFGFCHNVLASSIMGAPEHCTLLSGQVFHQ